MICVYFTNSRMLYRLPVMVVYLLFVDVLKLRARLGGTHTGLNTAFAEHNKQIHQMSLFIIRLLVNTMAVLRFAFVWSIQLFLFIPWGTLCFLIEAFMGSLHLYFWNNFILFF